jgi:hypothetical protein
MKIAERSLAERDTTRAPGRTSTRRSPRVGTRSAPGPWAILVTGKLSLGRPFSALKRAIASSESKTTVSPFGP